MAPTAPLACGAATGFPWVSATVLSGLLESLLAFVGFVNCYYLPVTTWAANAMDSALRNGPERAVPAQAIRFSALPLLLMQPFSWLMGFFLVEGLVRWLAAAFTGGEAYLEMHSSHRKAEWIPPKTVRNGEASSNSWQRTKNHVLIFFAYGE